MAWSAAPGSYAEQVALQAERAVPVPRGIDLRLAAAVMLQGMTAHYLCHSTFPVKEGDITVVHAAAGGVGLLLTQMIKRRGGVVVATTSSTAKAVLAQRAGADYVTTYDEFGETVERITEGRGADVAYDSVGKTTFDDSLAALRPRGMMVLYGGSSGQVPPFDPQRLNTGGSLYITRPTLGTTSPTAPSCSGARATCSSGSPKASSTCGSAPNTPCPTPPARTRTSPPAAPPASSSWCPSQADGAIGLARATLRDNLGSRRIARGDLFRWRRARFV